MSANWYCDWLVPLQVSAGWEVPGGQAWSRFSDQNASSWIPLLAAKVSSWLASLVLKTSLVTSFTPIIGVFPAIAHSCAALRPVQIWPSWVLVAVAASIAAWPMSYVPP